MSTAKQEWKMHHHWNSVYCTSIRNNQLWKIVKTTIFVVVQLETTTGVSSYKIKIPFIKS